MAKSIFFLASLLALVLSLSLSTANPRSLGSVGDFEPIKNISDPSIQSIGEFAVNEHNKLEKTELKFQKVISGVFQIVAGTNYELQLTALDETESETYGTLVYKDLNNKNHLIKFFEISN